MSAQRAQARVVRVRARTAVQRALSMAVLVCSVMAGHDAERIVFLAPGTVLRHVLRIASMSSSSRRTSVSSPLRPRSAPPTRPSAAANPLLT